MSKKHSKQRSFLEEAALEALDAAAKNAHDFITQQRSLLEGQEDNLFLNEATKIAELEMAMFGDAITHLSNIYKDKLNLLKAKVQLIDQIEKVPTSAISNDTCDRIKGEMKELNNKLKKRDLDFLNINAGQQAPQAEEPSWSCSRHTIHSRIEQIKSNRSVSFQNYHEQSTTCVSSNSTIQDNSASISASVINTGFIEKPQFSSDLGRKMSADVEAQASARRTRSAFTPSNMQGSEFKKPVQTLPAVAEKENRIAKDIFQSGGSSLDGSFLMNGVTMEDIMRPRSVTPGRAIPSQPNFDDTGLDEFEDKVLNDIPVPSKNDAPPMNIPITTNHNLGPIQHETPILHKTLEEKPSRPQFTSVIGQKLSNK